MGKIEITEDLRNKLNKVLSYKSEDIGDTAVGPAPKWKPPPPPPPPPPPEVQSPQMRYQAPLPQPPPQPPPQPLPNQQDYYFIKSEAKFHKKNKKKDKMKYSKITKVVFLSSIVAGIGITLGLKIANILFF